MPNLGGGTYYTDPRGSGSWYVNPGETPQQAWERHKIEAQGQWTPNPQTDPSQFFNSQGTIDPVKNEYQDRIQTPGTEEYRLSQLPSGGAAPVVTTQAALDSPMSAGGNKPTGVVTTPGTGTTLGSLVQGGGVAANMPGAFGTPVQPVTTAPTPPTPPVTPPGAGGGSRITTTSSPTGPSNQPSTGIVSSTPIQSGGNVGGGNTLSSVTSPTYKHTPEEIAKMAGGLLPNPNGYTIGDAVKAANAQKAGQAGQAGQTVVAPVTTTASSPTTQGPTQGQVFQTPTGAQNTITLRDSTGAVRGVGYGPELDNLLKSGWKPIDETGQPYELKQFQGGWIVGTDQGWVPIHMLTGGDWGEGQKNLIDQAVQSGQLPPIGGQSQGGQNAQGSQPNQQGQVGSSPGSLPSGTTTPPGTNLGFGSLLQGFDLPFTGQSVYQNRPFNKEFDFSYDDFVNSPAFRRRLQEGQNMIETSAANKGGLFSGRTGKELTRFGQELASEEFDKQYDRSMGEFNLGEGIFRRNEADRAGNYTRGLGEYQMKHDIFKGNQTDLFNRLSSLSGGGQTAASTLGSSGGQFARDAGNVASQNAQTVGNAMLAGASAQAGGRVGSTNARIGGLNNLNMSAQDIIMMRQLGLL